MTAAVILDALDSSDTGNTVEKILEGQGVISFRFRLREMNILPCRSCGSCGDRTPGVCAFRDDMPEILKALGTADMLVFLTRITFGGYSSQLKKAVDKLMVTGFPLYMVKKGHLLHPMRYGSKSLLVIGTAPENMVDGEEENFRLLAGQNALNFLSPYRDIVLHPEDDAEKSIAAALAAPEKAAPL